MVEHQKYRDMMPGTRVRATRSLALVPPSTVGTVRRVYGVDLFAVRFDGYPMLRDVVAGAVDVIPPRDRG